MFYDSVVAFAELSLCYNWANSFLCKGVSSEENPTEGFSSSSPSVFSRWCSFKFFNRFRPTGR